MKKLIALVMMLAVLFSFSAMTASAVGTNEISLSVETRNVEVGINYDDALCVTVYASWDDCSAMDIFLTYDADALDFIRGDGLTGSSMEFVFEEGGKVQYSAVSNQSSKGQKKLFECLFYAKKLGETKLVFSGGNPVKVIGQTEFTINVAGLDAYGETDSFRYSVSDGKVTLCNAYNPAINDDGLIVVPDKLNGMPVVAISNNFITYHDYVKAVVIPAGVKSIGAYAFLECKNLKNIYVYSDSVNIEASAFGWNLAGNYDTSLTIHGKKGSTAEKYAKEKGMFFHECSAYHTAEVYDLADVNGDGSVTSADARLALRAAAKIEKLNAIQSYAADVDGREGITAADARLILRKAAKID